MKIIIINGSAESGKDSVVRLVKTTCEYSVYNISTIDPIKDATDALQILRTPKDDIKRKLWSDMKDLWTEAYDGPFEYVKANLRVAKLTKKEHPTVCFVHSREPEEIARFREAYPECITLLVRRPGFTNESNHADKNVENYDYDYIIDNDSNLITLSDKVDIFIKEKIL